MKKRNLISRAVALMLLLCIAVTMLVSCDNGLEPPVGANPGSSDMPTSSSEGPDDKPMTAEKYFSQLRPLNTDKGGYSLNGTKVVNGVTLSLPMYGNTVLEETPVPEPSVVTSHGILFFNRYSNMVWRLSKDGPTNMDGLAVLFMIPSNHGAGGIVSIGGADENVVFICIENTAHVPGSKRIARYYIPEKKYDDAVLDLQSAEITAYLDRWQGEITEWQAINNQEIALTVRPMREHETDSQAYKTFIEEEYARLTDDAEAQKTVAAIRDGQSTEVYRPMIVYNTETKIYTVLYTLAQQKAYLSKSDMEYTGPKQDPDPNAKPTVQKGTVSGNAMSYKEYFSKMRLPWKQDSGEYYLGTTTNESIYIPNLNTITYAMSAYYGKQRLSRYSEGRPVHVTSAGILKADNNASGAKLLRLTKDGPECLIVFPEGTLIEDLINCDSNVAFVLVSTGSLTHRKEYLYRYYIPEARLELVAAPDSGKVGEVLGQHQATVTNWESYSNEDVLMWLDSADDCRWVAFNIRTGEVKKMYKDEEYYTYRASFGLNIEIM